QRADRRFCLELQPAETGYRLLPPQPGAEYPLDPDRLDRPAVDDSVPDGHAGRDGRNRRPRRRLPRRNPAAEALAALALSKGLSVGLISGPGNAVGVRLEQSMQMHDDIFHLGIVDG